MTMKTNTPHRTKREVNPLDAMTSCGLVCAALAAFAVWGADAGRTVPIASVSKPALQYSSSVSPREAVFFLVDSERSSALFESASAGEELGPEVYTHIFVLDSDQAVSDAQGFLERASPELDS